jgi:hypothetical protein
MEQSDAVQDSVTERMAREDVGREGILTSGMRWCWCLVHRRSTLSLVSVLCTGSVGVVGAQAGVTVAKAMPVTYWRTNLASESVDSVARMAVAPQAPSAPPIEVDSASRNSHVAAGIVIGVAAGVALGEYRAHHAAGCQGRSDCQDTVYGLLPDPFVYGVAGGVAGGIVAWLWSQR